VLENNHCANNTGGSTNYGIEITGSNNIVASNKTSLNNTGSILFPTVLTTGNRTEMNRCSEGLPTNTPTTAGDFGVADLADLAF